MVYSKWTWAFAGLNRPPNTPIGTSSSYWGCDNGRCRRLQVFSIKCRRWSECRTETHRRNVHSSWNFSKCTECEYGRIDWIPMSCYEQWCEYSESADNLVQGWKAIANIGTKRGHTAAFFGGKGRQGNVSMRCETSRRWHFPSFRWTSIGGWVRRKTSTKLFQRLHFYKRDFIFQQTHHLFFFTVSLNRLYSLVRLFPLNVQQLVIQHLKSLGLLMAFHCHRMEGLWWWHKKKEEKSENCVNKC